MKQGQHAVVNRIPPSTTKRGGGSATKPDAKRQKMDWEPEAFSKLNPAVEAHARRIDSRSKAIAKGKNTAGYDAYIQQIPKYKRRRSMETPSTPDHTLDIPAKRWQGLVKAWCVILRQKSNGRVCSSFHLTRILF